MSDRLERELAALGAASARDAWPPLRAVAALAGSVGELEPGATDSLGRRRHRAAARRTAETAVHTASCLRGAFGDRPELARARERVLAGLRSRAQEPAPSCRRALGELARLVLALPLVPGEDWQLAAIAFLDEEALNEIHDACVALAATALREAAAA